MTWPELSDTPTNEQITDYLAASYTYRTASYPVPVSVQHLDIVLASNGDDVVIVCARCRAVILNGAFYDILADLYHQCDHSDEEEPA